MHFGPWSLNSVDSILHYFLDRDQSCFFRFATSWQLITHLFSYEHETIVIHHFIGLSKNRIKRFPRPLIRIVNRQCPCCCVTRNNEVLVQSTVVAHNPIALLKNIVNCTVVKLQNTEGEKSSSSLSSKSNATGRSSVVIMPINNVILKLAVLEHIRNRHLQA